MCPSPNAPLNLIFQSQSPFVFQSDHGRCITLWVPALVCGRHEMFRTLGEPASTRPSTFTPQLGPGAQGGGRSAFTAALYGTVSVGCD